MNKRLSERQKRFVMNYIIAPNATKAAIDAGYAPKGVNVTACNLLKKAYIRDAIAEQLDQIRSEKIADATEVMEFLTAVMRGEVLFEALRFVGDGRQEIVEIHASTKDRLDAAELLGKRYGLFTDKVNIDYTPVIIAGTGDLVD